MTLHEKFEAFGGTVSYRELVAGNLTRLVSEMLVPTSPSLLRFTRWALAGRPTPDRGQLTIMSTEPAMQRVIREALARVPDAVAYHVVRNVVVAPVGLHTQGWCGEIPALPDSDEAPHLIALSGAGLAANEPELAALLAHELAHSWLSRPVVPLACATTMPVVQDGETPASLWTARHEWLVAQLAHAWGFRGHAADVDRYAADLRRARRSKGHAA